MADIVDKANDAAAVMLEHQINAARAKQRAGLDECQECGAPISALRRDMGAVRCVSCQTIHEHQAKQRWRG